MTFDLRVSFEGLSFDAHEKVDLFPSLDFWPIEREANTVAAAQVPSPEIGHVYTERRVACLSVVDGAPVIDAPMHDRWRQRLDAERLVRWHRAHPVVEPPDNSV
jgi:hypothetical protein